jgi:hypothetical protein
VQHVIALLGQNRGVTAPAMVAHHGATDHREDPTTSATVWPPTPASLVVTITVASLFSAEAGSPTPREQEHSAAYVLAICPSGQAIGFIGCGYGNIVAEG